MTRGRSQVIWRYMPESTFRYNGDSGWCRVTDVTMNKTCELKGGLVNALVDKLHYWGALSPTGYPDPRTQSNKYIVGEPYWVRYDIWPTIFMCLECKRMHWYETLTNLKKFNDRLQCRSCSKTDILRQTSFAYICPCGNMETLFVPKCPTNHSHPVCLIDVGGFQDSYWRCQTCNKPIQRGSRDGLGVRACRCGKTMRGVTLVDPRIYYSQAIAMVDIQPEILAAWAENEKFSTLLLGASLRIPHYKTSDIQNLSRYRSTKGDLTPEMLEMKKMLLSQGMSEDQVDGLIKKSMEKTVSDPWKQYIDDLAICTEYIANQDLSQCRQTIEYVFVRDERSVINISLDNLIYQAELNSNREAQIYYVDIKRLGKSLGLINMSVIQELPILLAGIGYSRYYASPVDFDGTNNNTKLRPYKIEENGKIPIYIARNTTEAFMYELDPYRMAVFLEINQAIGVPTNAKVSEHKLRSWLLSISGRLQENGESHLHLLTFEKERGMVVDLTTALMFGVLHTISHTLKATAQQYVGIDQDSLAEYLFPLHMSGLLYASSHVKFTLGGIDAVFRANLPQWLGTVRDFTNSCSFDPVCTQDGGACLACLYTKFGCNYFNRTLSRAFLYGGKIKGLSQEIVGFWSHRVTEEVEKLRKEATDNDR